MAEEAKIETNLEVTAIGDMEVAENEESVVETWIKDLKLLRNKNFQMGKVLKAENKMAKEIENKLIKWMLDKKMQLCDINGNRCAVVEKEIRQSLNKTLKGACMLEWMNTQSISSIDDYENFIEFCQSKRGVKRVNTIQFESAAPALKRRRK